MPSLEMLSQSLAEAPGTGGEDAQAQHKCTTLALPGATHRTGADSAAAGRYTAELRAVVERAYAMDYDIFRATGAFVNATPATGGRWHSKTKHLCRIKPGGFGEYCK